jgi:hypothetical protein
MITLAGSLFRKPHKELCMTLTRVLFLALAVVLPASWTVAKAGDEAPASETKTKKTKKSKKADGTSEEKTETKTEKKE